MKKLLLVGLFMIFNGVTNILYAADDTCTSEPTDMQMNYGDYILCSLNPPGDADVYRFFGNAGDNVFIEMLEIQGNFEPWLKITSPSGIVVANESSKTNASYELTLDKSGIYSMIARDNHNDDLGQYSIQLSCLSGSCLSSSPSKGSPGDIEKAKEEGKNICINNPSACGIIISPNTDGSTADGVAQCKKNPISCGINISPGNGSRDTSKLSYNATARLVPQVIMAGASPSVIDFNDNNLDVLAIVRPGALVINSVSLSQNGDGTFRIDMTKIATLSNNDQVWQSKVSFDRGSFGTGSVPITWGDGTGEFSITVTDGQQRSESFPSLKAGNYPILENK